MSEHGPALWTGSGGGKRSVQANQSSAPAADDAGSTGEVDATDAARALAADNQIDLATVKGTGADGRVTVDDVKALIETD